MFVQSVQAADEDVFLGAMRPQQEHTLGQGRSALWTMPLLATQYQPSLTIPAMQSAILAQHEGRFLDALIKLDEAEKNAQDSEAIIVEIRLLHASFLLQGNQSQQALAILTPLFGSTHHGANAYALAAMANLQQGKMQEALQSAQHALEVEEGMLPHLAMSYVQQGAGYLPQALETIQEFNLESNIDTRQKAIALAREAELELTLGQVSQAKAHVNQAIELDKIQPYVISVSGLVYLIVGQTNEAKAAFETALRSDPKDAKALLGLGLAEIKLGKLQQGKQKLLAANEAEPDNALILTYLGRAQWQSGETAAAMESWHKAELSDPKDPEPWLYQAQAELQSNRPVDARESLKQAQARTRYRKVYRGENLIREDEQQLQANIAEAQRLLDLDNLAFQTLSTPAGKKNSANLRNQADLLQGQRFGESARRSLLLQSLFDEVPGSMPANLDLYGDGAGQTGAQIPQHGVVSGLHAQQASLNNYDDLFTQRSAVAAEVAYGSNNTNEGQLRLGAGNGSLGISLAGLRFKTDGYATFDDIDNRMGQGIVQWQPSKATQVFVMRQTFKSKHGEIRYPADPSWLGEYDKVEDVSGVSRLGFRHNLSENSELRGLISSQKTDQTIDWQWISDVSFTTFPEGTNTAYSRAHSVELQYRLSGTGYATQWGVSSVRSPFYLSTFGTSEVTNISQQIYVDWQKMLNPYWQLEAGLARGRNDKDWSAGSTSLRRWLPKLGMVYTPDSATHVRFAAWKALDDAAIGNASLAPATLAGIVLNRPGDTYKLIQSVALGADRQLTASWLLDGQAQRRWTYEPYLVTGVQEFIQHRVDESRLALHWQPVMHPVIATLAFDNEFNWYPAFYNRQDSMQQQHLRSYQLSLSWFANSEWNTKLSLSHNLLYGRQQLGYDNSGNPIVPGLVNIKDNFNQVDASVGWHFSSRGSLDLGLRNAFDKSFQYSEIDPLIPRFSKSRFWYGKVKFAW